MRIAVGDDGPHSSRAEWFRVIEFSRLRRGCLHFIDERVAENFALFLLGEGAEVVVLEHWRDGARLAARPIIVRPGSPAGDTAA